MTDLKEKPHTCTAIRSNALTPNVDSDELFYQNFCHRYRIGI